ncbi:MAG TPA: tRNA 2-thiouridine(34) synthase MnmA [Phycisphaerae bacterium]|nr:tRNA 2-thiouridine(34) synthase MnmA [Phycisphaerae bacterium]HOJ53784.1 tRNA 2-thiouridine(34) synthase MnmA [Phycisphaerae bacterium]HOL27326.1 tRNA 2-thiouridine(34) synthase MnmA [Phycisphaerae bacterium]HPP21466.1 tRNA 2-thiouridine(34) synthase MnmA [Phycisphaerae bacterium]HPU31620.1 tRNA 2-thiouridine(34) synthase MnmA [Phycisphaerae bacterium]
MSSSRPRVIVAMSGGVDSSVAACLLHEQGYDVTGLFMRTGIHEPEETADACGPDRHRGCCSAADASDARAVAGRLNIPFFALNFKDDFDRIIDYFADEYVHGRTPNPCVMCNEHLKFGKLADYGRAVGADFIATGHYARIEPRDGRHCLLRGVDASKDQSYVLFGVEREMLAHTLFPIGHLTKAEVRAEARRLGLPVSDKPDSVDICFVPDRNYARVVRERRPEAFVEGPVLDDAGREVGRHAGIANYTIGQRQGLGIALGLPVYVTRIDPASNTIILGPRDKLASDTLTARRVHWLIDPPAGPFRAEVKIRYAHRAAPATVTPLPDARVEVRFDAPQMAITPGQAAVFYNDDHVLGGGWIE